MAEKEDGRGSEESLKLAVAISLLRSKILKNANESNALSPSQSNALLRWKRKVRHFLRFHSNPTPSNIQFYFTFRFSGQGKKARDPEAQRRSQGRSRFVLISLAYKLTFTPNDGLILNFWM